MLNIVAIVTPYNKNGTIDWNNLNFLINYHMFNKINRILILGTTGEHHNFNIKNYLNLILFTNKYNILFFFSINKNNIKDIFYLFFLLKINKNCYILISIPHSILPNNISLYKYFKILNKFGQKNIFYNIPKRSGKKIPFKLIKKIVFKKYFYFIKNSVNNIKNNLIFKNNKIFLLSGEDGNFLSCKNFNYNGTISVFNNIIPKTFFYINKKINFIFKIFNFEINPILIKNCLKNVFLIKGNFNLLLFNTEKIFFTQSQT